jgi:hypothetical protein
MAAQQRRQPKRVPLKWNRVKSQEMPIGTKGASGPNAMNNNAWDDLIFSEVCERWLKVARIISHVSDRVPNGPHFEEVAARIQALVKEGKLEGKGDLSRWLYSEVRLAQASPGARDTPLKK